MRRESIGIATVGVDPERLRGVFCNTRTVRGLGVPRQSGDALALVTDIQKPLMYML